MAFVAVVAACDDGGPGGPVMFDGDGFDDDEVSITAPADTFVGRAVAGPDGSLYVYGHTNAGSTDAASNGHNIVVKLGPDGRPDPTFGTAGVFTIANAYSEWRDAASTADGSLFLIMNDPRGPVVQKVRPDGGLDADFGTAGEVFIPKRGFDGADGDTTVLDVMIDADGTVVATGEIYSGATTSEFVVRIGAVNGESIARAAHLVTGDQWRDAIPDGAGGILLFGSRYVDLRAYPLIGRVRADLELDPAFGGGADYAKIGSAPGWIDTAVAMPGGFAAIGVTQIFEFDANADPLTVFDGDGAQPFDNAVAIATDSAGRLLVQAVGHLDSDPSPPPEYVSRLLPDGAIDLSYGVDGKSAGTAVGGEGIVLATDGKTYAASWDWPSVMRIRRLP